MIIVNTLILLNIVERLLIPITVQPPIPIVCLFSIKALLTIKALFTIKPLLSIKALFTITILQPLGEAEALLSHDDAPQRL